MQLPGGPVPPERLKGIAHRLVDLTALPGAKLSRSLTRHFPGRVERDRLHIINESGRCDYRSSASLGEFSLDDNVAPWSPFRFLAAAIVGFGVVGANQGAAEAAEITPTPRALYDVLGQLPGMIRGGPPPPPVGGGGGGGTSAALWIKRMGARPARVGPSSIVIPIEICAMPKPRNVRTSFRALLLGKSKDGLALPLQSEADPQWGSRSEIRGGARLTGRLKGGWPSLRSISRRPPLKLVPASMFPSAHNRSL